MTQQAVRPSEVKTPGYAWVILAVVFLASVAAPLNQFKVPPVMPVLIEAFGMTIGSAGWLMSIFAITGCILAIPAGIIMQKFGPKITGLISVGCVAAGAILGAVSNATSIMLFSRFIEGVGMGLISVAGPAAIAMWFPAQSRGMPMGIWSTWVPIGSTIMFNLAPALNSSLGWRSAWWAGAIFAGVAFVLYAILFRLPRPDEMGGAPEPAGGKAPEDSPGMGKAMSNRSLWLISFEFMCLNLVFLSLNTFYPTFLNAERGFDLASASFITSLPSLLTIISAPIGGLISDRIGSRKLMIAIPFALVMVCFLLPFTVTGAMITISMVLIGVFLGPVPTATFAAVPEIMEKPQLVGIGMAVLALGQNLGMVIGPAVFGQLATSIGWATAGYLLLPVCLIGITAAWMAKVR